MDSVLIIAISVNTEDVFKFDHLDMEIKAIVAFKNIVDSLEQILDEKRCIFRWRK